MLHESDARNRIGRESRGAISLSRTLSSLSALSSELLEMKSRNKKKGQERVLDFDT